MIARLAAAFAALSFVAVSFVAATPASAQMRVEVERVAPVAFDPFSPRGARGDFVLRIENADARSRSVVLELAPEDGGAWTLRNGARDLHGRIDVPGAAGGHRVALPLELVAGEVRRVSATLVVNAGQYADPGTYATTALVLLRDGIAGAVLAERRGVPLEVRVDAHALLSIAGTSGSLSADRSFAEIDFGELETGERADVLFQLHANASVEFTIISEHGGVMVNREAPASHVDYRASFDGAPLDLRSPATTTIRPAPEGRGSRHALAVTIGDASRLFAGTYEDVITVTVRPD